MLATILAVGGFTYREFSCRSEIEAALTERRPDLIILDLSLTGSDAVESLRSLATARYTGKILLISGHSEVTLDEVRQIGERYALSMLPPLHKPFRVDELRQRLLEVRPDDACAEEADLEAAIRNNWLELWYQPKIDLSTMLICGAEALIRLRHPVYGIVEPGAFLPPAGDPLYQPLTDFIVRRALMDWSALASRRITNRLAINVPASILESRDFVDNVRRHLPQHEKFPGLIVEITESEAIVDPETAREIAVQLQLYNVHVSIDDFGAGHSSLARLNQLPFAELKLDRRFVTGCATDPTKYAICRSVAELAHQSKIMAVAEGVESSSDLKALMDAGYDMAQGFIFAKPMILTDFVDAVLSRAVKVA